MDEMIRERPASAKSAIGSANSGTVRSPIGGDPIAAGSTSKRSATHVSALCNEILYDHAAKLKRLLVALDEATRLEDMDIPGLRLHRLSAALANHWSVWVNGNWRLTFMFEGTDVVLVDYQDYH